MTVQGGSFVWEEFMDGDRLLKESGGLYGVAISGAAMPFTGRLYTIDTATGAATAGPRPARVKMRATT